MFEKEAEEYCTHQKLLEDVRDNICKAFEDGAEFGYNKANEWHYVKDGDLPKEEIINAYNKALKLEKENAELKDKLNNLSKVAEVRLANWQKYEKENAELKERVKTLTIHDTNAVLNGLEMKVLKDSHRDRANKTQEQLTKAKKLIEKLLIVSCNSEVLIQYPNCKEVLEARVALEQFLKEIKENN